MVIVFDKNITLEEMKILLALMKKWEGDEEQD
jgi:hypothetical protein